MADDNYTQMTNTSAPAPPQAYGGAQNAQPDPYAIAPNNGHFINENISYAAGYDGYAQVPDGASRVKFNIDDSYPVNMS